MSDLSRGLELRPNTVRVFIPFIFAEGDVKVFDTDQVMILVEYGQKFVFQLCLVHVDFERFQSVGGYITSSCCTLQTGHISSPEGNVHAIGEDAKRDVLHEEIPGVLLERRVEVCWNLATDVLGRSQSAQ